MSNFNRFCLVAVILACVLSASSYAAIRNIEAAKTHSAAGVGAGCTVSGATNATPIVITCSAAHNLADGDQVQVISVGGNTNANTTAYAKVTGYSTTTFGMYSDANLTTGVAGNAAYTSGGTVSQAVDISDLTNDWTIKLRVVGLTTGKKILLSVQESADGFSSDIKTLGVVSLYGGAPPEAAYSWRSYQLPSARFGVANARLRVYVQSIDGSTSAIVSAVVEY